MIHSDFFHSIRKYQRYGISRPWVRFKSENVRDNNNTRAINRSECGTGCTAVSQDKHTFYLYFGVAVTGNVKL